MEVLFFFSNMVKNMSIFLVSLEKLKKDKDLLNKSYLNFDRT